MLLHFPCKEFAEESGKTGLRADTPFLPAYHFTQSAAVCQRRIALWVKKIFRKSCGSCRAGRVATLAAQPPMAPPMGELASEARLRGRLQRQIWEMSRDCDRVPSQSRLSAVPALPKGEPRGGCAAQSRPPPTAEPGDPQRCGSTARVAGSSLPAGAIRPLSHGLQPCQLSQRESQGRLRRRQCTIKHLG